jgi:outer membrane protein assembly factor BamB
MKKGILALACAGMIVLSGCYGSYGSTKWLHGAIGKISNKWAKSLVHFLATPAYFICFGFVDFFFVNTIEFWTGSNPFAAGDSYYEKDAQGNSVAAVKNEDGTLSVQYTTVKGETTSLTLQRDENVVRALDAEGNLVAQYEIEK